MGKKKRRHPDIEELLARPWCYYCERDFEDLKLLIQHQKAKHFKCDRCGRRLNTAGGLSVHMNQVHKESLSSVDNALPNRQGLDVEIFGMEGIPEEVVGQHNQRIIQNFYQAQADRFAATGNPPPGENTHGPVKKIKIESSDEIKQRLAEHRARVAAIKANGGAPINTPPVGAEGRSSAQSGSPGAFNSPFPPPGGQFPNFPPNPQYPPQAGFSNYSPSNLPARPGSTTAAASNSSLPPRPGQPGFPGYPANNASTVDDLVASASRGSGDDIDHIIRMAEAGIKPPSGSREAAEGAEEAPAAAAAAAAAEKKSSKKDKNSRMVYDDELSPEERLAVMPRYAWVPAAA